MLIRESPTRAAQCAHGATPYWEPYAGFSRKTSRFGSPSECCGYPHIRNQTRRYQRSSRHPGAAMTPRRQPYNPDQPSQRTSPNNWTARTAIPVSGDRPTVTRVMTLCSSVVPTEDHFYVERTLVRYQATQNSCRPEQAVRSSGIESRENSVLPERARTKENGKGM
jgi:hypothetical protein